MQGIARGDLPRDGFVFHVEQGAFFLDSFARAYAPALAKAPEGTAMTQLRALLDAVFAELELNRGYGQRWGARLEPEPSPATLAYTEHGVFDRPVRRAPDPPGDYRGCEGTTFVNCCSGTKRWCSPLQLVAKEDSTWLLAP